MKEKILTISIAAYNVEKYLDKTLSSLVCEQEIMDSLEVLIIDDESKDGTVQIAKKYESRWPDTFKLISKKNGGHGSTLNYSIEHAKGKYFKMLDGDDWFDTKGLIRLIGVLKHSCADIIINPYIRAYSDNTDNQLIDRHNLQERKIYHIYDNSKEELLNIHAAELTVLTDVIRTHNYKIVENCFYTDDEYVFLACLSSQTLEYCSTAVYYYRIGEQGQSVSDEGIRKHWKNPARVVLHILKQCDKDIPTNECPKRDYLFKLLMITTAFQYDIYQRLSDDSNYGNLSEIAEELYSFTEQIKQLNEGFYQHIKENSYEEGFLQLVYKKYDDENYCLFGCGKLGSRALNILNKRGVKVVCCTDNNSAMWGKTLLGTPVISPDETVRLYKKLQYIVVSKVYSEAIRNQLIDMGIGDDKISCI